MESLEDIRREEKKRWEQHKKNDPTDARVFLRMADGDDDKAQALWLGEMTAADIARYRRLHPQCWDWLRRKIKEIEEQG